MKNTKTILKNKVLVENLVRQGDVLLKKVNALPEDYMLIDEKRIVVRGMNNHILLNNCIMYRNFQYLYIVIDENTELYHPEHSRLISTILTPGIWEVHIQVEGNGSPVKD